MATATMATAAGAAALLYYTLNRRLQISSSRDDGNDENNDDGASKPMLPRRNRVFQRPARAPATWMETISTLSETFRFTYSETLGKWPIGDLAFGISFLLKRQGNLDVATIYAGNESVQLKGAPVVADLKYLLNLLTLCWHFSKKPFPLFLEATGYSQEDVLLQEPKAGILKPAFTVLTDKSSKCILLLIRGTHSIRDTLTAVTGAVVPFHHTVVNEGGVSDLVLGYAHCGMVAAARWIAKLATPCLLKALHEYPDYNLKVVGHSLGGGTAAILTYVLREQKEFATTTCVAFAPAACMTLELAESGRHFITSIVNGADLVPTFSTASVDDLRSEVTSSAWLTDLRSQIEHTRILSTVYRSASALGSRLPSIANGAKARVAGAGAILRPVSNRTQVVMRRARTVAQAAWTHPPLRLSSWSCIGPRHRNMPSISSINQEEGNAGEPSSSASEGVEPFVSSTQTFTADTSEVITSQGIGWTSKVECSETGEISCADDVEDDEGNIDDDLMGHGTGEGSMNEVELWQQLENELYRSKQNEVVTMANELRDDENGDDAVLEVQEAMKESSDTVTGEVHRFYPPGKLMHIVAIFPDESIKQEDLNSKDEDESRQLEPKLGIFLTPRSLYGKIKLSKAMINDHFMPIYRRNIEQLICEMEKEISLDGSSDEVIS